MILIVKKLLEHSTKSRREKKVIKRKSDRLYVKWKGYNNSFNRGINMKDIAI